MSMTFDYEIIAVNDDSGTMDVRYSAAGCAQHIISVRQPTTEESFEDVIRMYAPIPTWELLSKERQSVAVGTSATLNPIADQEPTYADLRFTEYPPIEDYVDGIVKGDEAQVQAYIDACLAVKAKYPKA